MVKKLLELETRGPDRVVACCVGTRISVTMSTWMWLLLGISLLIQKNEGGFAILTRHFSGTFGGEWDTVPQVWGTSNKYSQYGCPNTIGKTVCWNKTPPVHVSVGGGPQDQVR
ncbi:uncharacterized protein LOC128560062 isoform X2 [Nycticebus coucang]|uniref:uncharacterized protein LOC128560062 isoform X2 n=1 Tax=Nycticebus coucang TaxID=9470 RepID=UPI00234DC444|nr:uncharacterized protein LOC128560062 isoform X2 [Nycticebus coucang]